MRFPPVLLPSRSRGFTLLEVLVALSICAMAGIAAMQVSGEHINHLSTLEEQAYASWVAENQLVEIMAQGNEWPARNKAKGKEEMAGQTWYWQQEVTKSEVNSFVEVRVFIYRDEALTESVYDLSTFVFTGGK
ncbi:general secretion pathway protein I [Pseudoalteromonas ulvae UL12]|uniref:Type II secretion system protein I n=1 Tax=Pseudoalteromonas ulvae TaxID=107327 RepID=A0A244CP45_PSEDV|nr:type II secretion system minor pseudopilin GspI [Pseudoalteromonas ulvae]MBE0364293.1 general secretion pathway protein I [Pseudoalteromonas ulvae UL12]OUL57391.1 type II secretion system protein GspI [Pseudoalteromonas ulvae]